MKVTVNLKQSLVTEILLEANKREVHFDRFLVDIIKKGLDKDNEEEKLRIKKRPKFSDTIKYEGDVLQELLFRVTKLAPGEEFVVKEIISDMWGNINNTISFGHRAAKFLQRSGLTADIPSTSSSRRYKRI